MAIIKKKSNPSTGFSASFSVSHKLNVKIGQKDWKVQCPFHMKKYERKKYLISGDFL